MERTKPDYAALYQKSRGRMARMLLEINAPDVIVLNEARILLATDAGGAWRAVRIWVWKLICIKFSNAAFELEVFWLQMRYPTMTREKAIDRIIDRIERAMTQEKGAKP